FTLIDTEPAGPDDVRLTDRTCRVDGSFAVAGGVLTNTSGAEHGFAVTVQFLDGSRTLGSATEELEHDLEDGASWSWEVQLGVDPEQVNTDSLECRVDRVDIGEVVSD
ncbi:MAG TPA: FxLYD domain-containing protein, partial [Acidimicrobiales bacterium]|nr:FxLYD domain-containing protein [Acidimicrobiales bacterium]